MFKTHTLVEESAREVSCVYDVTAYKRVFYECVFVCNYIDTTTTTTAHAIKCVL